MAARKRRKPTGTLTTRASFTLDVALYARWGACAALGGLDRGAFAVKALEAACQGLILIDKRKARDQVRISDRPDPAHELSLDGPDDAA